MPTIMDSWSESNWVASTWDFGGAGYEDYTGQSFTADGNDLDSVKFYLKKTNSPTGSAYAEVYAHTGTFGTDSLPTGAVLATSDAFDVSTLTGSMQLITFTFSGANRIALTNTTKYVVVLNFLGGDTSNQVNQGTDTIPGHAGNASHKEQGASWAARDWDNIFYVYGEAAAPPPGGTLPGFRNLLGVGQ